MAKIAEIYDFLNEIAPVEQRIGSDNVGLLVGHSDAEVTRVLAALDVLPETILEAETLGAQLIVAHHPVIFRPAASITDRDTTGLRVMMLVQRQIAAICMHTNLDVAAGGVNDALAARLGLWDVEVLPNSDGVCRFGMVESAATEDFAAFVRDKLRANGVRFYDAGRPVKRVTVGGGACGDYVAAALAAGCDTLVVGDAAYHEFLEARMLGLNLIDAGHFPTEDVVVPTLVERLGRRFPDLTVTKSAAQTDIIQWR